MFTVDKRKNGYVVKHFNSSNDHDYVHSKLSSNPPLIDIELHQGMIGYPKTYETDSSHSEIRLKRKVSDFY